MSTQLLIDLFGKDIAFIIDVYADRYNHVQNLEIVCGDIYLQKERSDAITRLVNRHIYVEDGQVVPKSVTSSTGYEIANFRRVILEYNRLGIPLNS